MTSVIEGMQIKTTCWCLRMNCSGFSPSVKRKGGSTSAAPATLSCSIPFLSFSSMAEYWMDCTWLKLARCVGCITLMWERNEKSVVPAANFSTQTRCSKLQSSRVCNSQWIPCRWGNWSLPPARSPARPGSPSWTVARQRRGRKWVQYLMRPEGGRLTLLFKSLTHAVELTRGKPNLPPGHIWSTPCRIGKSAQESPGTSECTARRWGWPPVWRSAESTCGEFWPEKENEMWREKSKKNCICWEDSQAAHLRASVANFYFEK